jgi:hypothetical protein
MRVATAVLIVLAGVTVIHAQQLERRPFYPPPQERTLRPLFPTAPLDSSSPSLPVPPMGRSRTPQPATTQPVTPSRSGSVCLKAVPVDPSIDRGFALSAPDTRDLPMRTIEMPPCVTPALPKAR